MVVWLASWVMAYAEGAGTIDPWAFAPKDILTISIASLALLISFLRHLGDRKKSRRETRAEVNILLDEAFDLLGGEDHMETIVNYTDDRKGMEAAKRKIDLAKTKDSKYAKVYWVLALFHGAKGQMELHMEMLNKAIAFDPKYPRAYNSRGVAHNKKGEYDRAIEDHDRAIALDSKYAAAFNNRGLAYNSKGEHDRAIEDYDRAIALEPKYANPHFGRGFSLQQKGELVEAKAAFETFLDLASDAALIEQACGHLRRIEAALNKDGP